MRPTSVLQLTRYAVGGPDSGTERPVVTVAAAVEQHRRHVSRGSLTCASRGRRLTEVIKHTPRAPALHLLVSVFDGR